VVNTRQVWKAGRVANEHFLDAQALEQFFASRLKRYGKRVSPLIFKFGTFNKKQSADNELETTD
jgi:hypothetical protein